MPYQVVGKSGITKVFTAVPNPGVTLQLGVAVKSFIIKPVGGNIIFKFDSTITDANGFPINDGEALQMDLSLTFPYTTNVAIIGYAVGSCPVYVCAAY